MDQQIFLPEGGPAAVNEQLLNFEPQLDDTPIDFQQDSEEWSKFRTDFRTELLLAKNRPFADDDVRRWRDYFSLRKPSPPYEDGPAHTVPIIRSKVRGFLAHAWRALNKDPMFVMRTYSQRAAESRAALETTMERELDRVRGQRQIYLATKDVGLIGTVFLGVSMAPDPEDDENIIFPIKAYRLENFFVSPTGVEDLTNTSVFIRGALPKHIVDQFVARGVMDGEAAKGLTFMAHEPLSQEQERQGDHQTGLPPDSDNGTAEIFEAYFRWRGELRHVFYSEKHDAFLRAKQAHPYVEALGGVPPYVAIRIEPELNYIYGTGIAASSQAAQDIADFAFNSNEAYQQHRIAPAIFANEDSAAFGVLADEGLQPGKIYGTLSNPQEEVFPLLLPPNQAAFEELRLVKEIVDSATFNDNFFSGEPITGIRSATEVNAISNASSALLADYLSNLAEDLGKFARMYWAMIYEYKIKRNKFVDVVGSDGQFIVGAEEVDEEEFTQRAIEFAITRGMTAEEAQQRIFRAQAESRDFIPGGNRRDYEWIANGAELVPNKLQRAGLFERIFNFIPLLQLAKQSREIWHLLKDYFEALDLHAWRRYIGDEPGAGLDAMNPEDMDRAAAQTRDFRQGGGGQR